MRVLLHLAIHLLVTLEVILQQGVYAGLPYAMQALAMWEQAVEAFQEGRAHAWW